jgi:hypothetical protein
MIFPVHCGIRVKSSNHPAFVSTNVATYPTLINRPAQPLANCLLPDALSDAAGHAEPEWNDWLVPD